MAENYKKSYRKSSHSSSRREIKSDSVRRERKRNGPKCSESRTPPLPPMENYSIEELLQKREFICEHLNKIKHANNNQEMLHKSNDRKRRYSNKDNKNSNVHKESSEGTNQQYEINSESEDEEYIIELRRKQRKQLLDQLNQSRDKLLKNDVSPGAEISTHNKYDIKKVHTNNQNKHNSEKTPTDMFSEKDDFPKKNIENITQDNKDDNSVLADNWDDQDGYYKVRLGDYINNNRYTIKSTLGQGVFANVVRAQDQSTHSQDVAIKIIRNNEFMQKTGLKEIAILKEINENDPDNKYHCIKLLHHFIHKGHLCLVLEPFYMDMRSVLKKYGQHQGINLSALMNYTRQLLLALKLLTKIGVIHADIKPDNILVNEKKNVLKLCDFGSATKAQENEPTPYLVSRYYRAPEIILGIPYSYGVDIWSTACTIYEMATSTILFTGRSNNKMLKCFMDLKGRIPNKLLRKSKFKDQHFNYKNNFLLHKTDKATEREKVVEITNVNICRDLHHDLKKYFKKLSSSEEKKVLQLKDLLDKMLMLDDKQRLSVANSLKHSFLQIPL